MYDILSVIFVLLLHFRCCFISGMKSFIDTWVKTKKFPVQSAKLFSIFHVIKMHLTENVDRGQGGVIYDDKAAITFWHNRGCKAGEHGLPANLCRGVSRGGLSDLCWWWLGEICTFAPEQVEVVLIHRLVENDQTDPLCACGAQHMGTESVWISTKHGWLSVMDKMILATLHGSKMESIWGGKKHVREGGRGKKKEKQQ